MMFIFTSPQSSKKPETKKPYLQWAIYATGITYANSLIEPILYRPALEIAIMALFWVI